MRLTHLENYSEPVVVIQLPLLHWLRWLNERRSPAACISCGSRYHRPQGIHRVRYESCATCGGRQLVTFGIVPTEPHTGYDTESGDAIANGYKVALKESLMS